MVTTSKLAGIVTPLSSAVSAGCARAGLPAAWWCTASARSRSPIASIVALSRAGTSPRSGGPPDAQCAATCMPSRRSRPLPSISGMSARMSGRRSAEAGVDQPPLETLTEQRPQAGPVAHPVEQSHRIGDAVRRQVDGERGLGALAQPGEEPAAQHGRGAGVLQAGGVDVALAVGIVCHRVAVGRHDVGHGRGVHPRVGAEVAALGRAARIVASRSVARAVTHASRRCEAASIAPAVSRSSRPTGWAASTPSAARWSASPARSGNGTRLGAAMACSSVMLPSAGTGRVISSNGVADGSSTNTGSAERSAGFDRAPSCGSSPATWRGASACTAGSPGWPRRSVPSRSGCTSAAAIAWR